jgi:hypothetical protein
MIGDYVIYKGQKCLVTGVMKKRKSDRGAFFRLWNIKKNQESWTGGALAFENVIERKSKVPKYAQGA